MPEKALHLKADLPRPFSHLSLPPAVERAVLKQLGRTHKDNVGKGVVRLHSPTHVCVKFPVHSKNLVSL